MHLPALETAKRLWNAFVYQDSQPSRYEPGSVVTYASPSQERRLITAGNERSILTSVHTRMAMDVASVDLRHVAIDAEGRYLKDKNSRLNRCLTLQPNIDQGPRAFRQDIAATLFEKGVIAIVPVDTSRNPNEHLTFDVHSLRVGEIVSWGTHTVLVSVYNERKGKREEVRLLKRATAIVENPLYAVMNAPNSTFQRLARKLHLLDVVDELSSSGKLDLIVQLPYQVRSERKQQQAEQRRKDIEFQLRGSRYGIAYTDGTEKVTQLNRPAENNLLKQVETLTKMLYDQLGLTDKVLNGTASEDEMLNYQARTVEPVVEAVVEAMQRTFLGTLGTLKSERIMYLRDPFKLVPLGKMAEISNSFSRNEIFTSNELRGFMGVAPHSDPKADKLENSNMPQKESTGLEDEL